MQVAWYVGLGRAWFSRYSPSLSSYLALPPPPFRPWLYALVSAVMKNNDKLPTNQTSRSFRYVKLFRTFCAIKRTCTYFRSRKILNYYLTDCFFLPILYRFWKSIFHSFLFAHFCYRFFYRFQQLNSKGTFFVIYPEILTRAGEFLILTYDTYANIVRKFLQPSDWIKIRP